MHLRQTLRRPFACSMGAMTGLRCCSAFMTCCCVARSASKSALLPSGCECRRTSASGGVCVRHCSTLFMKQVLPRFWSPAPCKTSLSISSHSAAHSLPQKGAAAYQACAQQHLYHKWHVRWRCGTLFMKHALHGIAAQRPVISAHPARDIESASCAARHDSKVQPT